MGARLAAAKNSLTNIIKLEQTFPQVRGGKFESPVRQPSANVNCQSWCEFGVWVGGTRLGAIRAWLAYEAMGHLEVTGQISDGASFT